MHTLRPFALAAASALALTLQLTAADAARAGDVTYPQLQNQTSVQDQDIIAIWRNAGPLAKLNASLFSQYVVNGLGVQTFAQRGNNLSDLTSAATARSNLGLGSAATATVGVSGTALCQLNSNCTWTGAETFNAAVTFAAGVSVSPSATNATLVLNNPGGDQSLVYYQVGGVNKWLAGLQTDNTTWFLYNAATGKYAFTAGTGGVGAGEDGNLTLPPTGGAIVNGGFTLDNGPFSVPVGSISGAELANGAVGNAQLAAGAVVANIGYTPANASSLGALAGLSSVDNAHLATASNTIKGNSGGGTADLTPAQVMGMLGMASNPNYQFGSVTIPTPNGNIIINWGNNQALGAGGSYTDNFTTNYFNGAIAVATGTTTACGATVISTSQVTIHNASSGQQNCYWIAIGN